MPIDTLRGSAPSMEVLIENLPGNVYRRVRSPEGKYSFEFLSSGLFRNFDIDNERLLRATEVTFDWIHPDDRERFVADLEVSAATMGLLDHRVRVVGMDGRVHWARGIARPSRRPDGSVVWDGIVIDVTREVEAEAELRIAKGEAERAHTLLARSVGAIGARLRGPVMRLAELSEALATGDAPDGDVVEEMRREIAVLSAMLSSGADADPARGGAAPPAKLTPRQSEILAMLRRGQSNKAIALALGISPGTVKLHVSAILKALDTPSRRSLRAVPRA
ncbi:helix-turn-helix transcriptional regulator [Salinarimonas ramus]|uniref:PAS domain S-box-containing protein n=1 Tax=Salinarimonas ramus TaxID=690164 RepID=A0A917Q459_9HYPH|nr:LuxR C-terminal-related transcriptional regulator [Salinarimonas ramus]GGK20529.1 hypothetical protein GCM10011322_04000 [Salinarimonas ramus]